jgi:hypothetical protein
MARLYGRAGLERLRAAHVLVVGVGGVGSWTVEALARTILRRRHGLTHVVGLRRRTQFPEFRRFGSEQFGTIAALAPPRRPELGAGLIIYEVAECVAGEAGRLFMRITYRPI